MKNFFLILFSERFQGKAHFWIFAIMAAILIAALVLILIFLKLLDANVVLSVEKATAP